jgi:hypothetical protein
MPRGHDVVLRYNGPDDWSTDWLSFDINEELAARAEPEPAPEADNVVAFQRPAEREPDAAPSTPEEPARTKWDEMIEANRGQTSIVDAMREMWSGDGAQPPASHRTRRLLRDDAHQIDDTGKVVPFTARHEEDSAHAARDTGGTEEANLQHALQGPEVAHDEELSIEAVGITHTEVGAADLPRITAVWGDEDDGFGEPVDPPANHIGEEADESPGN